MSLVYIFTLTVSDESKRKMLLGFAEGVKKFGDKPVKVDSLNDLQQIDNFENAYGIVFGWSLLPDNLRVICYNHFVKNGGDKYNFCFFEGNALKSKELFEYNRAKPMSDHNYYRLPFGSIMCNESIFRGSKCVNAKDKLKKILNNSKIKLSDWKVEQKKYVIIYCNKGDGGWSHQGVDQKQWLKDTIHQVKDYTDRKIVIKAHPLGDDSLLTVAKDEGCSFFKQALPDNIYKHAHSAITLSSTAGCATLVDGIPTFALQQSSFMYDWGAGDICDINNPKLKNRNDFLEYYAKTHWSAKQITSGQFWKNVREEDQ